MCIKVSVVIPTYKRPALLLKCLSNLQQQNFSKENYEVIIITDGPDNTKNEIAFFLQQQLFFNVSCYSLKEKKGPAAARNKGVEYAKGELIVFTDDDCLPQKDWINEYWNAYTSLSEKEAAFTGKTIVPHAETPTDYEQNIMHLQTAEFITANCAIPKKTFKKVNGFDEDFTIAWREDSDMHFKLLEASVSIYTIKNAVVIHPVRKANWGVSLKEQKKSLFNALLYKKHPHLYKQKITPKFLWNYYTMILLLFLFAICVIRSLDLLSIIFFIAWFLLLAEFIFKRLKTTSKKIIHIAEIAVTSLLIPFLSVFWTLYGSFKYKTLLL